MLVSVRVSRVGQCQSDKGWSVSELTGQTQFVLWWVSMPATVQQIGLGWQRLVFK